ncbi:MAG TPA: hypothetical protein VMW27_04045, partial [Thermoanaerobaculia bacterium]|nr:hypothetical protein [Thermoanaerobaculia bacterium]
EAEVDHPRIRAELAHAQRVIEGEHGDIRQRLYAYARVLETQRAEIQGWRQEVLEGRDRGGILSARSLRRWRALLPEVGEPLLRAVERRLTLHAIDRCWSEHLTALSALRDELPIVRLDGRDPLAEFFRAAKRDFETLLDRIDETASDLFERIAITPEGVDWEKEGIRGPSSTWTYLVHDRIFETNVFTTLSNRASFGLFAVLVAWPILLLWGLAKHWKRWRERREAAPAST